jgi:hypothetical protein
MGYNTLSVNSSSSRMLDKAPIISLHVTSGTVANPSRLDFGRGFRISVSCAVVSPEVGIVA